MTIDDCAYGERVGIMQYDGHLSRGEAEQKAWMICYRRTETDNRPPAQKPPQDFEQLDLITREQYLDGIKRYL